MGERTAGESLHERIRARLAAGNLPALMGAAWAGEGAGDHRCACCHRTIRVGEIEYEPREQPTVYAHIECFTVWLSESRLALERRPPARMNPPRDPGTTLDQAS